MTWHLVISPGAKQAMAATMHPMALGYSAEPNDLLQQATFALNANRPQEAQRIAEQILKTDPRRAQALHILGGALLMQDRAAETVAALEDAARTLRDPQTDTLLAIALRGSAK